MKKLCVLLLILFSLSAAATEPPTRNKTQAPEKKTTRQVLPEPQPDKRIKTTGKKPAKKPPEVTPFIPSEKINADAVVAFPVDI